MWLGIKNVIRANHMISLITSSTTDPILSSATCRTVNVMDIFNSASRRRYGDRLYTSPSSLFNLGNVIHHKSVKYKIPLHFIDQSIRLYHTHLQQNTRSWCLVSILKISSLNLLIAPVQVPHSYIICLATF